MEHLNFNLDETVIVKSTNERGKIIAQWEKEEGETGDNPVWYQVKLNGNRKTSYPETELLRPAYRAEVAAINENVWSNNGMTYATEETAKHWLDGLSQRWFGYNLSRVVPVDTPYNQPVNMETDSIYQNFRH